MSDSHDLPTVWMESGYGSKACAGNEACERAGARFARRVLGRYIGRGLREKGQQAAGVLDLEETGSADAYYRQARKVHKGNAVRDRKKAEREGLYVKRFAWKNYVPDIVDINASKEVRSGGQMSGAYRRGVEEMGGNPTVWHHLAEPGCGLHYSSHWGVFEELPGHRNGELRTDDRLVGYIRLKRHGDMGVYSSLLGHGDYLHFGIMYLLHFSLVEHLLEGAVDGPPIRLLMYGGANSGTEGLRMWKKRTLFMGAYVNIVPDEVGRFPEVSGEHGDG